MHDLRAGSFNVLLFYYNYVKSDWKVSFHPQRVASRRGFQQLTGFMVCDTKIVPKSLEEES
jgi:hypothetical protein